MHASILNSTLSHWNHIVNFSNTSNYIKQKQFLKFCGMFYANDKSFFFFFKLAILDYNVSGGQYSKMLVTEYHGL